jgi:hypothetical protein
VFVAERVPDRAQLHADENEEQPVDEEDDHVPERARLQAGDRVFDRRLPPTDVEAGDDDRKDAGRADPLGKQVGRERRQQTDDDDDAGVVGPRPGGGRRPADRQPDDQRTGDRDAERRADLPGNERSGRGGDDRQPKGRQGDGVVDEAFPFQNRLRPARKRRLLGDRDDRGRVGVRDDRAEDERRRPGEAGEAVGRRRHADRRHQDQSDRQRQNRAEVGDEIAPGSEKRRHENQGRNEQEKDDVRRELNLRHARHETERRPAEDEDDRIRQRDPVGDRHQRGDRHQQREDELDFNHRVPARRRRRPAAARPRRADRGAAVRQSSGVRFATISARRGSRNGGSTTVSPSVASSSSTANPGPSVAISNRTPFGSRK